MVYKLKKGELFCAENIIFSPVILFLYIFFAVVYVPIATQPPNYLQFNSNTPKIVRVMSSKGLYKNISQSNDNDNITVCE